MFSAASLGTMQGMTVPSQFPDKDPLADQALNMLHVQQTADLLATCLKKFQAFNRGIVLQIQPAGIRDSMALFLQLEEAVATRGSLTPEQILDLRASAAHLNVQGQSFRGTIPVESGADGLHCCTCAQPNVQ